MPLPKPGKEESKEEFIERFMSNEEAIKEFPERGRRFAVAQSAWRKKESEGK
jgi:hypothetical protein